jgi:hypothetical protein
MPSPISLNSMERLEMMIALYDDILDFLDLLSAISVITDLAGENPPAHVMEGVRKQANMVFQKGASA